MLRNFVAPALRPAVFLAVDLLAVLRGAAFCGSGSLGTGVRVAFGAGFVWAAGLARWKDNLTQPKGSS